MIIENMLNVQAEKSCSRQMLWNFEKDEYYRRKYI